MNLGEQCSCSPACSEINHSERKSCETYPASDPTLPTPPPMESTLHPATLERQYTGRKKTIKREMKEKTTRKFEISGQPLTLTVSQKNGLQT